MTLFRHGFSPPVVLLLCTLGLGLAGCEGDDGSDGTAGAAGTDGTDGADGISCWDLNQNGVGDLPGEDLNGDGVVDTLDCNPFASEVFDAAQLHRGYFAVKPYEDTSSCLDCHGKIGDDVITTGHFKWEGLATNIVSAPAGTIFGKNDIINNFCVAVASNEGRCSQCHIGYGYADNTFDFDDPKNVDCLVCHDQTTTYAKAKPAAGAPEPAVDLNFVAQSVADNEGVPTIYNCIDCHAGAGGDDNVKHGDLAVALENTTREFDVHMGTDGANLECVACHQVEKDADDNVLSHGIGGMPYHSVDEGVMVQCDDGQCHGNRAGIHAGTSVEDIVTDHDRLACQVCHIPTFARDTSTKVEWYWSDAGLDADPNPPLEDPATGRDTWAKKKGTFVWANNVRPTLRYFNGKWEKFLVGVNDVYTSLPAVLAEPVGDCNDPESMIYPFKKMIGNQPADANNQTVLVPHLFGTAGGPNPFWGTWDWNLALQDAANITGQPYTGAYEFIDTVMYLTVNHEIAPKEEAYGFGGVTACPDCHLTDAIEWSELGWTDDPLSGGDCP